MLSCVEREWVVGGGGVYGASWNKVAQSSAGSVLNNFTGDALTVSAGSVFLHRQFQKPMGYLRHRY